jgi:hypothetical protein
VRLAIGPDGTVAPDIRAKAPGRGAWVQPQRSTLETAIAKGKLKAALARSFKTGGIDVPDTLAEQLDTALKQATLDRLGLESRASTLLTGSEKIENAARSGLLHALYHASDASIDGNSKLDQAWRVGSDREGQPLRGTILPVDRMTLSMALGRQNVVHIGVVDEGAARRISHHLSRWIAYSDADGAKLAPPH